MKPQVLFIVQTTLEYKGKKLSSGKITAAWSSNEKICNAEGTGILKDRCFVGKFQWTDVGLGCETLHIYNPVMTSKLMLGFERLCKGLPFIPVINTTYWIARQDPLRLSTMDTIVAITEGSTKDGKPNIVDYVLGDFDYEVLGTIASFDRITGPGAEYFIGFNFPVGLAVEAGRVRWGYFYISEDQQSLSQVRKPKQDDGEL
jgi:hypothetical protein